MAKATSTVNIALIERMLKATKTGHAATLADTDLFEIKDIASTNIPIFDIAFTGEVVGGVMPGITQFAADSKHFKTSFCLACVKGYLDKFPDAMCIFYDSEFGSTPAYFSSFGIDPKRVLHVPFVTLEELKVNMSGHLEAIQRGEHVIMIVDSIGLSASKKELEDAQNNKDVKDMTRAQVITGLSRVITPHIRLKNIPVIIVNHVYDELTMYPKTLVKGGKGLYLATDRIFFIRRTAERQDGKVTGPIVGYNFELIVEKSRTVKEKSKFPITVTYDGGISRWSGLFDLVVEAGMIARAGAWYSVVDPKTGEVSDEKVRGEHFDSAGEDFWMPLLNTKQFKDFIVKKFQLSHTAMFQEQEKQQLELAELEESDA